jgi:CBS domain-containing protein
MTWNAIVATSEWDVMEAARTMQAHGFRHLLVIDGASANQIGILSIRDLMAGILACTGGLRAVPDSA